MGPRPELSSSDHGEQGWPQNNVIKVRGGIIRVPQRRIDIVELQRLTVAIPILHVTIGRAGGLERPSP